MTGTLSIELLRRIFHLLDAPSLASAGQVCKEWWELATDEEIWQHLCHRHKWELPNTENNMTYKQLGRLYGLQWVMRPTLVMIGGKGIKECREDVFTKVEHFASVSGFSINSDWIWVDEFDWSQAKHYGLILLVLLPSGIEAANGLPDCTSLIKMVSSLPPTQALQGVHIAVYLQSSNITEKIQNQWKSLLDGLANHGVVTLAARLAIGQDNEISLDFNTFIKKAWRETELCRGWCIKRKTYKTTRVLGPTSLKYSQMNSHHLLSGSTSPVAMKTLVEFTDWSYWTSPYMVISLLVFVMAILTFYWGHS